MLRIIFFKEFQESKDPRDKDRFLARATDVWDQFVTISPTHPKAPDIAFLIAEQQYAKAARIAAESDELPEGKEKEAVKARAREAYLAAVPLYQRVVDQFTTFDKGNYSLRNARYRYIRYADGSEELYDHQVDRNEWTNLAARPQLAEVKAEFEQHLP